MFLTLSFTSVTSSVSFNVCCSFNNLSCSSSPASAAPPIQNNPVQFDGFQSALSTAVQMNNSTKVSNAEINNLQGQKGLADAKAAATLSGIGWYKFTPVIS